MVVLEEAGRADGTHTAVVFSYFLDAVHFLIDDPNQLAPMKFGRSDSNSFYTQGTVSYIDQAMRGGFKHTNYTVTSHFSNETMLELCRIRKKNNAITAAPGSPNSDNEEIVCNTINAVWGVKSIFAFADVRGCDPVKAGTSTYSCTSVVTALHAVQKRLKYLIEAKHESPAASITYMTLSWWQQGRSQEIQVPSTLLGIARGSTDNDLL